MATAGAGARSSAGNVEAAANPQFKARIQLWMRAYPRRWRVARGEELADLVVDLAGPDVRRLGPRAAVDLVRGGWATRWREHPPFHTWLLYRAFDHRIPSAYRSWASDDIDGLWYSLRLNLLSLLLLPLVLVILRPWPSGIFYISFLFFVALGPELAEPDRLRRKARLKHLMPMAGEPLVAGKLLAFDVPRDRASARSALHWAMLWSGAVVALSVAVTVVRRWSAAPSILLVALVLGVLTATMTWRRLTRFLGECPPQPHRVLRPVSPTGKARVLVWVMLIAHLAWLDLDAASSLGISMLTGAAALIPLCGALAALLVLRRGEARDLAGDDLWLIAVRGRLPAVDQPVSALRPEPGPVPDGAVVQPRRPADPLR